MALGETLKKIARESTSVDDYYEKAEAAIPDHLKPSIVPHLGEFYVEYGPHTERPNNDDARGEW